MKPIEKVLSDEIGFVSKEHLRQYKNALDISDILSTYSRQFDSNLGAMTFAYLAVVGDEKNNDLLNESFKFFLRKSKSLLEEMEEKIRQTENGGKE